jgi:hypothetical protein
MNQLSIASALMMRQSMRNNIYRMCDRLLGRLADGMTHMSYSLCSGNEVSLDGSIFPLLCPKNESKHPCH